MHIESFFHSATSTWCHVLAIDGNAAIIDPVLDYDSRSGNTSHEFAERLLDYLRTHQLQLRYVWETHAHADHLSAGAYLKAKTAARLGIGAGIRKVQAHFSNALNITALSDQFDDLINDGDTFALGSKMLRVIGANGHTPDSLIFLTDDAAFIGDTLFAPDVGSARCDFPGGSAKDLYATAQKILALPASTKLYLGHDYPPCVDGKTREPLAHVTVAEQRTNNIHLRVGVSEDDFIAMRQKRDAALAAPNLLWPALNCNIRGGALPEAESNGVSYLKIPLNRFKTAP